MRHGAQVKNLASLRLCLGEPVEQVAKRYDGAHDIARHVLPVSGPKLELTIPSGASSSSSSASSLSGTDYRSDSDLRSILSSFGREHPTEEHPAHREKKEKEKEKEEDRDHASLVRQLRHQLQRQRLDVGAETFEEDGGGSGESEGEDDDTAALEELLRRRRRAKERDEQAEAAQQMLRRVLKEFGSFTEWAEKAPWKQRGFGEQAASLAQAVDALLTQDKVKASSTGVTRLILRLAGLREADEWRNARLIDVVEGRAARFSLLPANQRSSVLRELKFRRDMDKLTSGGRERAQGRGRDASGDESDDREGGDDDDEPRVASRSLRGRGGRGRRGFGGQWRGRGHDARRRFDDDRAGPRDGASTTGSSQSAGSASSTGGQQQ